MPAHRRGKESEKIALGLSAKGQIADWAGGKN